MRGSDARSPGSATAPASPWPARRPLEPGRSTLTGDPPLFSVIIPTQGEESKLLPLLNALAQQTFPTQRRELIVVFDGQSPTPRVRERLEECQGRAVVRPERRGPGAARNAGARESAGVWLAFTEDDCLPSPNWLERAARRLETERGIDVLEGETVTPGGAPARRRELDLPNYLPTNLFIRRKSFDKVGGYCERYFDASRGIYFREDSDLGFALEAAGARVMLDPDLRVTHPTEHPRFLDPIRWARRYEMDPLLERRHPARFRSRIEVARLGPLRLRRPFVRVCIAYALALLAGAIALVLGEGGVAAGFLAIAGLLLLPVWAKWKFALARLLLVPIVPLVLLLSLARGTRRR